MTVLCLFLSYFCGTANAVPFSIPPEMFCVPDYLPAVPMEPIPCPPIPCDMTWEPERCKVSL